MAAELEQPDPDQPDEFARLPKGRHGLPPEFVAHNQRERLIAGFAEVVAKVGFNDVTITGITKEAAVSSRTFYKYFETKEDCFLAALDAVVDRLTEPVRSAWDAEDAWPLRLRAAIGTVVRFFTAEPALARLSTVEVLHAGPVVAERWEALISRLAPYLHGGLDEAWDAGPVAETMDRGILGGMLSLVTRRIIASGTGDLDALIPDLVQFALTPYVGVSEAARVAAVPA